MRKMLMISLAIVFTITSVSLVLTPRASATTAGFQAGRIMDDGVMTNPSSMTVSQIQAFLNSKVPNCDTYGTQPSEFGGGTRAQWAAARGVSPPFICLRNYIEGGVNSAQIIYNVAQKYTINPQVLIVLLQKEQGLVTDTWPLPSQYKTATGYGCPDTAPCDSQYYGLTNQLDWAAKLFRAVISQSPTWYSPYVRGTNYIQWNPSASCGGSNVNVQNWTTASLYDYTPYQPNTAALAAGYGTGDSCSAYGNRNFYSYFTDWFGSTQFPQPTGASLYYQQSSGAIYLVDNSTSTPTKYYIPSQSVLQNYGLDRYPTIVASDATLQGFTDGGVLSNLTWDTGGVYLINNGERYHVSGDMCTAWGLACYDSTQVKALGSTFQTQYLQQGPELTNISYVNGILYKMSAGTKQPIANPKTLSDLGLSSTPVFVPSNVNAQQPLGTLLITTPGIIRFSSTSPIYYFDGSAYYATPDMNSYYDWSLAKLPQLSVPTSSYNQTLPTSTTLSPWVLSNGQKYIIDQGRKISIPNDMAALWADKQFVSQPSNLIDSLPSEILSPLVWTNPSIYYLDSTGKHHVTSTADYTTLAAATGNTSSLREDKLSSVTSGNDYLADGKLISIPDGTGKMYVINNHKLTLIPSPGVFNAYGFNWGAVQSYPATILTDYPLDTVLLGNSTVADSTYYVVSGSSLYQLTGSLAKDFGLDTTNFSSINKQIVKQSTPTLPRFLYNTDDGAIYYASGQAIHYVATLSAYRAYNGPANPIAAVNSGVIHLFTESQPLY